MAVMLIIAAVLVLVGLLLAFVGWCGMAYMHWLAVRYVPPLSAPPREKSLNLDGHRRHLPAARRYLPAPRSAPSQ